MTAATSPTGTRSASTAARTVASTRVALSIQRPSDSRLAVQPLTDERSASRRHAPANMPPLPARNPRGWAVPGGPWILHSTPTAGTLTERWIELQVQATDRYDSRLLALNTPVPGPERPDHWFVAGDRWLNRMAYRGMFKSGGLSPVWLARQFRDERAPTAVHVHYG